MRDSARQHAEAIAETIRRHGATPDESHESVLQNGEEYASHDAYWLWCLRKSLALCEHSLYCPCAGARRDDLSILTPNGALSGPDVPGMELLLNRLKSEYCLSRALLYQSETDDGRLKWNVDPCQGTFTDLLDDEVTGLEPEFLRTSFRLCFGILDRIARGVCEFLSLSTDRESIYFNSFWRAGGKENSRWDVLSTVSDPGIIALYSLATDLNEKGGGEWSRLKQYRNLFEHEVGIVCYGDELESPAWLEPEKFRRISVRRLRSDATDALRFTRAAIFYFTFFVRSRRRVSTAQGHESTITFSN